MIKQEFQAISAESIVDFNRQLKKENEGGWYPFYGISVATAISSDNKVSKIYSVLLAKTTTIEDTKQA